MNKRIYVAGAMSSHDPIQFMENLRRGQRLSTEVILAGYSCFSPFIDIALFLQLRDGESIGIESIQQQSLAWLEVSDAVLVVSGWQGSKGTLREMKRADELGIPIYFLLKELQRKMPCGN